MGLKVWIVVLVIITAGCAAAGSDSEELVVFAAASLTEAFGEIERAFEEATPGVDVRLNLAGSSTLREQILEGAPASVFASANPEVMDQVVVADKTVGVPVVFARNRLVLAVPSGNPAGVRGLGDLGRSELFIGTCAPGVPCGDLARTVLSGAGVELRTDTNEPDVRALLTKLAAGELDAGLMYATDVLAAGDAVEVIPTGGGGAAAAYPIAALAAAPDPALARAFVAFVLSDRGREILADHGFEAP